MTTEQPEMNIEELRLQAIAKKAKELRANEGLTQAQVSESSGLSIPTIQRIERGEKASSESYAELATTFGEKADFFDTISPLDGLSFDPDSEEVRQFMRENGFRAVPMQELTTPMMLEGPLRVAALTTEKVIVGAPETREEVLDILAEFEQLVSDARMVADDLGPMRMREVTKDIWFEMERLKPFGYLFGYALDSKRPILSRSRPEQAPDFWDFGFLVIVRADRLPRFHRYMPAEIRFGF